MFESILNRLKDKKILVLGFGREGKSTLRFLSKYLKNNIIGVADKNFSAFVDAKSQYAELIDSGLLHFHSGDDYLQNIYNYDIVIKTPGISLKDFNTKNAEITSQTDLFLGEFHSQTIGISGTKGKSTTTSLIFHLLKSAGGDAVLTGNIGIPCFDVMEDIRPKTIVVYELSAHQLEYVHNGPKVGVLLNVFEEHLDHFGTFERYKNAKLNLLRFMQKNDCAVVHESLVDDIQSFCAKQVVFSTVDFDVDESRLPLLGEHNILNIKASLCACSSFGIDGKNLIPYLYTFKPLEHRLERVGTFGGVTFFNDSISTIPQAAIAACKTLKKVDFLLLGGFDRDIDYSPLIEFLLQGIVPHLLFTGKAGDRMMKALTNREVKSELISYSSMEEAFSYLGANAKAGDVCLLSPAASSYDQYKNFEERGRKFKSLSEKFKVYSKK